MLNIALTLLMKLIFHKGRLINDQNSSGTSKDTMTILDLPCDAKHIAIFSAIAKYIFVPIQSIRPRVFVSVDDAYQLTEDVIYSLHTAVFFDANGKADPIRRLDYISTVLKTA